jgi:hypothetical protein
MQVAIKQASVITLVVQTTFVYNNLDALIGSQVTVFLVDINGVAVNASVKQ